MLPAPPSSASEETHAPPPPDDPHAPAPSRSGWSPSRTTWTLAGLTAVGCAYVAVADPNSTASWYPQCPFRTLTGLDCPGCGITRSIHAALTGHPGRALDHNALFVIVAVLAVVWFGISQVRQRMGRPPLTLRNPNRWWIGAGVVVGVWWVVRNIGWGPFAWLGSGA